MTKEQRESIKKDLERSITRIARWYHLTDEEIESILIDDFTDVDDFTVICWPEVQELMEEEDFYENAALANIYGSSAYFVRKSWLNSL